jgi:hypothetical protein
MILDNFDLVQILNQYLTENSECFPVDFSENVFFVVDALLQDLKFLDEKKVEGICRVLVELMACYGPQMSEICIKDGITSMTKITKIPKFLPAICCHNDAKQALLIPFIIDLISHENIVISQEAVQFLGGIFLDDNLIEDVLKHDDALDNLTNILYKQENVRVKHALWAFSNLSCSKTSFCDVFVKSNAFRRIVQLASSHDLDLQAESVWTLANAVTCGSSRNARDMFLSEEGAIISILLNGLKLKEQRLILNVLEALSTLLHTDIEFDFIGHDLAVTSHMNHLEAEQHLHGLQGHPNSEIYEFSIGLIKKLDELSNVDSQNADHAMMEINADPDS